MERKHDIISSNKTPSGIPILHNAPSQGNEYSILEKGEL